MRNVFFLCTISLFWAACQDSATPIVVSTPSTPNPVFQKPVAISKDTIPALPEGAIWENSGLTQNNNIFALQLGSMLCQDSTKNLIVSPYSISASMGLAFLGSLGESEKEIGKVFQWGKNTQNLHKAFAKQQAVINSLQNDKLILALANRIWVSSETAVNQQYVKDIKDFYNIDLYGYDKDKPAETAEEINKWVESQTKDKVHNLLNENVVRESLLLLVNAIYFYGEWLEPFDKKNTKNAPFTLENEEQVSVPFMSNGHRCYYYEDAQVQVIELFYNKASTSMLIVLPKTTVPLTDVYKTLNLETYTNWIKNGQLAKVSVSLPIWKSESYIDLVSVLSQMGMPNSFNEQKALAQTKDAANFKRINIKEKLFVRKVVHKAVIEVSETGTEAAAATVTVLDKPRSAEMETPKEFKANRPFLYFIKENKNNTILFMGQVYNPSL